MHPVGNRRFDYDSDCFIQGNHCSNLEIEGGTALKTLNSELRVIELGCKMELAMYLN